MTKPWWTRALLGRTAVSNPLKDPLKDNEGGDPQFEAAWRPLVRTRVFAVLALLVLWVVCLEARLFWVQVVSHEHWATEARNQQQNIESIDAPRGSIFDRNGRLLAGSVTSYNLYVSPKNVQESTVPAFKGNPAAFAKQLCQALADCEPGEEASIVLKLAKPKGTVLIRRASQMSTDAVAGVREFAKAIRALVRWQNLVSLEPREVRFYPNMNLAAHVIGFLDASGAAMSGVEKQFDHLLSGTPGKQIRQVDGLDRGMGLLTTVIKPPKPGVSIELTIDLRLQEILERELANGVEVAGALGGTAVMLDSATGQVVAMGSLPAFNLNLPGTAVRKDRNRAVQDLYEPGSTFKMVTLAAALNEGIVNTTTLFDTSRRPFMVEGRPKPITEDKNHNYGTLDVQGILVHSSNIGAAMVGLRMGPDLMLRYAKALGFGKRDSASDFFSERLGAVYVPKGGLTKASLAVVSYGYQINASPLQIVAATNVFANGGVQMQPQLVHATIDRDVRRVHAPQPGSRVLTAETAATMTTMLEGVVEDGTGDRAALTRYRVAGKTGTTKQVGKTGYSETDYLVSFVGFAPSRHPRFTTIVVVERPTKVAAYGGAVSAPIFKRITEQALHYVGEPPSINAAPAVVITGERPQPVRPVRPEPPTVFVSDSGVPTMPDLTGLTLRDARRRLPPGLTITAQGDGVVVSQSPAAGEPITTNRGVLTLQRTPVKTGGSGR